MTEEDLEGLPEPVQRYLRYTGTVGREYARTMRVEQNGAIKMRPDGRWLRFVAEEFYTTDPVAFVWSAKVKIKTYACWYRGPHSPHCCSCHSLIPNRRCH